MKTFPCLYYHSGDKGYKLKTCEFFPAIDSKGGHAQDKFTKVAVQSLKSNPKKSSVNVCFIEILKSTVTRKVIVCYCNIGEGSF